MYKATCLTAQASRPAAGQRPKPNWIKPHNTNDQSQYQRLKGAVHLPPQKDFRQKGFLGMAF